jgi:hypothetical protein
MTGKRIAVMLNDLEEKLHQRTFEQAEMRAEDLIREIEGIARWTARDQKASWLGIAANVREAYQSIVHRQFAGALPAVEQARKIFESLPQRQGN